MTLDVAQFLLRLLLFFIVYIIAVTTSGAFKAWVAYLCGDDTAQEEGYVTLDPSAHIDPIGLICFYALGFGWGRRVPIDERNIWDRKKLVLAYMADTFIHILTGVLALVVLVAVFGPSILDGNIAYEQVRSAYPCYTALVFATMLMLLTLIRLSIWLAALSGITNVFKLIVLMYFPEKQYDSEAQYIIQFGPLLLMILLLPSFMSIINWIIMYAGQGIAHILKLL